jgi:hypothetical protein
LLVAIVKKRFASLYEMPQKLNLATFEKPSLNTLLSTVAPMSGHYRLRI